MTKLPKYHAPPELKTAHDVRHMCGCDACGGLGDNRVMLPVVGPATCLVHGRCYIALFGMADFLALPSVLTDELRWSDIGDEAMRILVDHHAGGR